MKAREAMEHCNCRQELEIKLQEKMGYEEKPSIPFELFSGRTYTVVTVRVPNPRRKSGYEQKEINIFHSYCPFCGKPYPKDESEDGNDDDK